MSLSLDTVIGVVGISSAAAVILVSLFRRPANGDGGSIMANANLFSRLKSGVRITLQAPGKNPFDVVWDRTAGELITYEYGDTKSSGKMLMNDGEVCEWLPDFIEFSSDTVPETPLAKKKARKS